jgi:Zn-dependent M28 family amino/carboxypeptidase
VEGILRFILRGEAASKASWVTLNLALLVFSGMRLQAQPGDYRQLPLQVIESRLRQYAQSNPARKGAIKRLFQEAGCASLSEQPVGKSASPNVVCELPGADKRVIIVGAHFDHVRRGDGVVDNWSGASLLPSLFQSLQNKLRRHTFLFVSFTDEEKGLIGSRAYTQALSKDLLSRIEAMVDIDTLGLGPTEVWVHNSDARLVKELFSAAAASNIPAREMNVDGVGDSDGHPFKDQGIPVITLHSVTNETLGILHTDKDNISAIRLSDYYGSYQLISAFLAGLDSLSFSK